MKQLTHTLWFVVLLALGAAYSGRLVEDPPYPVSSVHICLVFLLAVQSWYCLTISGIRRSYGFFAGGVAVGFLALANGLFPDLWLRRPEATLLGFASSQMLTLFFYRLVVNSRRLPGMVAGLIMVVSLLPLAATVYLPYPIAFSPIIAGGSVILLAGCGWKAWRSRQRKQSPVGLLSLLFFTALITAFLAATLSNLNHNNVRRQLAEEYLLFSLLILTAGFVADQLSGERQLRSGPHMELDASLSDPLTTLANRRALELYGPQLINQSFAAGRAVSVIMADIDHFKSMNDTHGHPAGDTVLRQTAFLMKAKVRKSDMVARYGGEEFVIILPGSPLAPALRLAERMRSSLENDVVSHESLELKRTASFGVATAFPEEPASLADLIHRADINLYRAKHEGRNTVMADALPTDDF